METQIGLSKNEQDIIERTRREIHRLEIKIMDDSIRHSKNIVLLGFAIIFLGGSQIVHYFQ